MKPIFIFPSSLYDSSIPDSSWEEEFKIASELTNTYLIDFLALDQNKIQYSLRRLLLSEEEKQIIYRGWFISEAKYFFLEKELSNKNYKLINNSKQFLSCHHISGWIDSIKKFTPETKIIHPASFATEKSSREIVSALKNCFGQNAKLFLKDEIKSLKFDWNKACFISDLSEENVIKVVNEFTKLQSEYGTGVNSFYIFRKFYELNVLGYHEGGMPYSEEYRAFVYKGKIISLHKYWEKFDYEPGTEERNFINKIIDKTKHLNNFYTIDIAREKNGKLIVIELGDGQVSCIQDSLKIKEFYSNIINFEN